MCGLRWNFNTVKVSLVGEYWWMRSIVEPKQLSLRSNILMPSCSVAVNLSSHAVTAKWSLPALQPSFHCLSTLIFPPSLQPLWWIGRVIAVLWGGDLCLSPTQLCSHSLCCSLFLYPPILNSLRSPSSPLFPVFLPEGKYLSNYSNSIVVNFSCSVSGGRGSVVPGWSGFQGPKWLLPLCECVCVSPPQIDQIAHTLYLADTGQAYREQGEVEWWVGVKLNEEEKDGGGGRRVKAGVSVLISPACLSFRVPKGWVRVVIVTLDLCACVCVCVQGYDMLLSMSKVSSSPGGFLTAVPCVLLEVLWVQRCVRMCIVWSRLLVSPCVWEITTPVP